MNRLSRPYAQQAGIYGITSAGCRAVTVPCPELGTAPVHGRTDRQPGLRPGRTDGPTGRQGWDMNSSIPCAGPACLAHAQERGTERCVRWRARSRAPGAGSVPGTMGSSEPLCPHRARLTPSPLPRKPARGEASTPTRQKSKQTAGLGKREGPGTQMLP